MKQIECLDALGRLFVINLAEALATDYEEVYGEYTMAIPSEIGKGQVKSINFPNGVGFTNFEAELNDDLCLEFLNKNIQPLKVIFCTQGSFLHQFTDEEIQNEIHAYQSTILGSKGTHGHRLILPKNKPIHLFILDIDRKKFMGQLTFPVSRMEAIYRGILADADAIRTVFHYTPYSLKIAMVLEEIHTFKEKGLQRTTFIGSKALELFSYVLILYKDDFRHVGSQHVPRRSEIEKIKQAIKKIDEELEFLPLLGDLAQEIGLSEAKLQEGFKSLYNLTVNEYIQKRRLERSMLLLKTTDMTIAEIMYKVGLNSKSHFSKIFKNHYGISPSMVRKGGQGR